MIIIKGFENVCKFWNYLPLTNNAKAIYSSVFRDVTYISKYTSRVISNYYINSINSLYTFFGKR